MVLGTGNLHHPTRFNGGHQGTGIGAIMRTGTFDLPEHAGLARIGRSYVRSTGVFRSTGMVQFLRCQDGATFLIGRQVSIIVLSSADEASPIDGSWLFRCLDQAAQISMGQTTQAGDLAHETDR
ncbi:MAG: hypothetical protein EBV92_09040 [Betaproteobacteria bacterium]|nr:hypothetical protein [Betaproteobacteria bacterium]